MLTFPSASKTCFICSGDLRPYLAQVKDYVSGESFDIAKCSACGLGVTQSPPLDLSPYYRDYYGGRHGFTAEFRARQRLKLIHGKATEQNSPALLDLGCGEGTFLLAARKEGWTVAGTEMNPEPTRKQGLNVASDISVFAGREFDCITLWHSLEHMRDPETTLREIHPLMKRNAWLVVAVPDADGWQARWSCEAWLHLDVPRHLFHFSRASLKRLHEKCGFTVQEEHHQEFEYDVLGWSQSALNKIFPTRNLFFLQLTGKSVKAPAWERTANVLAGPVLSTAAVPAVWLGAACKRGGTLVLASRKV